VKKERALLRFGEHSKVQGRIKKLKYITEIADCSLESPMDIIAEIEKDEVT
jgi:hypothetical protein